MWTVPLVLGHLVLTFVMVSGTASSLGSLDTGLIVGLAWVLAARFRDIGWPAWIGPTILLVTMLGLPILVLGVAIMNNAGDQIMQWLSLYGLIAYAGLRAAKRARSLYSALIAVGVTSLIVSEALLKSAREVT